MQQLMGTADKNNAPKTRKFTQENENGNRMGREITLTKHGTLCLPEILEHEAVRTPTF